MQKSLTTISMLALAFGANAAEAPQQTRVVWTDTCSSIKPEKTDQARSGILGAVLLAVAPKLIEGAVDAAANALKAAGETKSVTSTGKTSADFYAVNPQGDLTLQYGCVRVIRGDFSGADNLPRDGLSALAGLEGLKSTSLEFEAKIEPIRGLKYFRLRPVYLKAIHFADSSIFSKDEREYTIALSLAVPGGTVPFGSATFTFPSVKQGEEIRLDDWRFANASSEPIAFAPESADATKVRTKRQGIAAPYLLAMDIVKSRQRAEKEGADAAKPGSKKPITRVPSLYDNIEVVTKAVPYCGALQQYNKQLHDLARTYDERCKYVLEPATVKLESALKKAHYDDARLAWANEVCGTIEGSQDTEESCSKYDPDLTAVSSTYFSTSATLVEARPGSKFAKFLGEALGASKADVSAAIGKKIIPQTSEQKDAVTQGERDARRGIIIAEMQVTQAEESLAAAALAAKPADITAARIIYVKAKIAVNDAYRKAGLAVVPYPELD